MKRYTTFDFIRGIGIIAVIIVHRIVWDYYYTNSGLIPTSEIKLDLLGILFLFLSMAGIFYVMSGAVNTYVNFNRLKENQISIHQLIISGWITGLSLIVISYIFRFLLFRSIKDWTALITYFVLYGEIRTIKYTIALASGTLWIIGALIILVSTLMGIYIHFLGFNKIYRLYIIYMVISLLILALTVPLTVLIGPSLEESIYSENWIYFFFFSPLVYGYFPIFPYVGFGCLGAILGLALAKNEKKIHIASYMVLSSLLYLVIGLLLFGNSGSLVISYTSLEAIKNLFARQMLQLSFYFLIIALLLFVFDFSSEKYQLKWKKNTYWINEFGKNALTIYVFEGFVSAVMIRIFYPFWNTYSSTLLEATLFGLLNLVIWIIIFMIWRKTGYIGSLEWIMIKTVKKISGKRSTHFEETDVKDTREERTVNKIIKYNEH
ncbi:MAG: heparan-alpha-glucosaminide N-acetyltransferase domain-containing protein [Candidatus Hodarchaeales archaeon]|jgi:fucose 4-O-acetylase-like acetyltransferase